jgi:hypothetical protein
MNQKEEREMINVPLSEASHQTLTQLAEDQGASVQSILEQAIEDYRRKLFLMEANSAYQALRGDSQTWEDEQEERRLWESAMGDGLRRNS